MRTLAEIDKDYTMLCVHLGDHEVKRAKILEQLDAQKAQLMAKIDELAVEAAKAKELQAELDKQKAEAAKEVPVDQVVEVDGKKYAVEGHLSPSEAEAKVRERLAQ